MNDRIFNIKKRMFDYSAMYNVFMLLIKCVILL